jgi:hypothetical protein
VEGTDNFENITTEAQQKPSGWMHWWSDNWNVVFSPNSLRSASHCALRQRTITAHHTERAQVFGLFVAGKDNRIAANCSKVPKTVALLGLCTLCWLRVRF